MGDSRKAIADDELDWANFKTKHSLYNVNWDVYSEESRYAQKAVKEGLVYHKEIRLFVKQELEKEALNRKHKEEWNILNKFMSLNI